MSHRRASRRARMNRNRRHRGTRPLLFILLGLLGVAAVAGLAVFVVFPELKETLGIVKPTPTPTPRPVAPTPTPSPTPVPLNSLDFEDLTQQPLLEEQYAGYPVIWGGQLAYAKSGDGMLHDGLMLYDVEEGSYVPFASPSLENDTFANLTANESWLCYLDHKEAGGGVIMAIKKDGEPFAVKTYYAGMPKLSLAGDMLVWMERTGTYMDKLFAFDLNTSENVTLHTFRDQRLGDYGTSGVNTDGESVVWAYYDPEQSVDEFEAAPKSSVHILDLASARTEVYRDAGTYVHDPVISGGALAWVDGNHSPGQTLWLRIGGGAPEAVAQGVIDYAFGDDFLLYCQGERLYARMLSEETVLNVTPEGERAIFAGISNGYILWYDVTDAEAQGTRDVLKIIKLP